MSLDIGFSQKKKKLELQTIRGNIRTFLCLNYYNGFKKRENLLKGLLISNIIILSIKKNGHGLDVIILKVKVFIFSIIF